MTWSEGLRPDYIVAATRALLAKNGQLRAEIHQLKSRPRPLPENPEDTLDLFILWSHRLTPREQQFVDSVQHCSRLSARQWEIIWNIAKKNGRLARAGT